MSSLHRFIIFPGQLTKEVLSLSRDTKVLIAEAPWVFLRPSATSSDLVVARASLQALRERLLVKAFEVSYLESSNFTNLQQLAAHLVKEGVTEVQTFQLPLSLHKLLQKHLTEAGINLVIKASHLFLTQSSWLKEALEVAKNEKKYAAYLRQKLGLLVNENLEPEGGSWNLPQVDKRKIALAIPHPEANRYVDEARAYVTSHFRTLTGGVGGTPAPVTFADAEDQLEYVLEADWQKAPELACSRYVMPSISLGLISPRHVIERILIQQVPLAAKEGFLRPILKREYQLLTTKA
jgi:deoxyribodipyrimidine photolyase-like uncharacterized protein